MTVYRIWPTDDFGLDANIKLDGQAVILHSRGGGGPKGSTVRNGSYESALIYIVRRLTEDRNWITDVILDSARARALAPRSADRVLVTGAQIDAIADPMRVVSAIRRGARVFGQTPGAKGGNSTKQIRIETSRNHSALRAALRLRLHEPSGPRRAGPSINRRLTNGEQRRVTDASIHAAVRELLDGGDAPKFDPSRDYDVLTETGERLAPKKVFGLALEIAGVVAEAKPGHFSAGWTQPCFKLIQAAGYTIVAKTEAAAEADRRRRRAKANAKEVDKAAATVGVDPEERSWIEGDKRMATHLRTERKRSSKAAAAKRATVRAANDGRLACEHCDTDWYDEYGIDLAEAIFDVHHTIPLSEMDEGHLSKVGDLLCLCANCHRAEHRRMALVK